ncbi:MAG: heme ABC transporter ATP-binding protein CcmA, partial [Gammaproteobacteria bacterium AqS3]|nr:heme ABC transporter ATP-binding protein CcmA [Gammaproteobacteria bacterium AqS3]
LTALDAQARDWFAGLIGRHLRDGGCAVIASHAPLGVAPDAELDLSAPA